MTNQRDAASRINLYTINLEGLTADPTDAKNGDVWHRSDLNTLRCKLNGIVVTITTA